MTPTEVFARRASGLVRQISPAQLMFFNFLTAPIWVGTMFAFTQNPNTFAGGNLALGILVMAILATPMYLAYSMVYSAFPRTGTDYVFQSRVLHPAIGFATALGAWVIVQFWFVAWDGISIVHFLALPYLASLSYFTGDPYYASMANTLLAPEWVVAISFAIVIVAGLIVLAGLRLYLKIQVFLFFASIASVIAMLAMLASTPHDVFVANFNAYMSAHLGASDSYGLVINTAQEAGFDLAPSFTWFATIGAVMIPWTWTLEWPIFGNLGLGGEMRKADAVKTHGISILCAFYLVCIGTALVWILFVGMVGEEFWNALSYLTWNGHELLSAVPVPLYYPFVVAIGTNAVPLLSVFMICASLNILSTQFTIYVLVARMLFAQTFDRMFPSRLAYVSPRTRTPVYIMIVMILLSCIWTYAVIFFGHELMAYFGSTQFLISLAMIFTMVGAIVFPKRLRSVYERSPAARYKLSLPLCAAIGILLNLIVIYYLLVVPDLYATIPESEALIVCIFLGGIIYYYIAKIYRQAKGIDITLAFREIPPE